MVIKVGIIGLSSVTTNVSASPGDSWAASAHLSYLLASPHYEIVALCNSSVESAQIAAQRYGLPSNTKAYGNPEDLAKDPNVDLVVCSVRVDRHHQLMMPVIEAGKDVYVEWPLASNLTQATEMYHAAQKSGSKTIVGLQARSSPFVQKIKELVENKTVGDLLSSTLEFTVGWAGDAEPPAADYFAKKESGGNFLTIPFGHTADPVFHALGGLEEVSALLTTRWPKTKFLKADGSFDRMIERETPDHVMLQGTLKNNGAPISMAARNGQGFKDSPNLVWRIFGTKGEIRLTSVAMLSLALGGEKLEVFDHEKDTVEVVEVEYAEEVKDLAPFAKNIGMLYEGFFKGWGVEHGFVDFEQAVGMHTVIDRMEKSSEGRKYEKMTL
ncbi:uncharacterized protein ALTATR162_LOCUS2599 [Alternaria atra]|uniref:Gfo/Idh/MocA-like oxidoreductase N-terminal domain-containing protein n=1 Tax=Alternaria atra TaxID=119953 RepID=A0A8J2HYN9_9PLEO|nr:uncharacterized protein ALTATR162_LOCUS2599 [Alternaria atra]CAG5150239.1 unnamed protein product [Alternaria atra]